MDKRAILFKNLNDNENNDDSNFYDNSLFEEIINNNDKE